ncbi:MAG: HAD-IB family hydrolase [Anaerolineae bacterium]|nr:HAD-IB family hydrolase [Anaerolineae bacterium]
MIQAALFDVDGTLVDGRVWRGILEYPKVSRQRVRWHYTQTLPHWLRLKVQANYETQFRDRWVRGLAGLLKGWPEQDVEDMAAWIADDFLAGMYRQDVVGLAAAHREQGQPVVLVSTMFPPVLRAIARRVGADAVVGTAFEVREGVLTGRLAGESCVGPRKLDFAQRYLADAYPDFAVHHCAAYADSYSDAALLGAAAEACAVYPDAALHQVAQERGWRIYPDQ